jgi:hypothetical protein
MRQNWSSGATCVPKEEKSSAMLLQRYCGNAATTEEWDVKNEPLVGGN